MEVDIRIPKGIIGKICGEDDSPFFCEALADGAANAAATARNESNAIL